MNRTHFLTALVALLPSATRCLAQASSSLPVIRPKVTELGEFRSTTLNTTFAPQEPALSPRGTLIAYITDGDPRDELRIWNVSTHTSRVVLTGWFEGIAWSPAGDAIAVNVEDGKSSQDQIWMLRLDPVTGESTTSPQRVSSTPTNGSSPQFSPDGATIAFARRDSDERSSLVLIPAAGGAERVLASNCDIQRLRWAADGRSIDMVSRDSAKTKAMLSRVAVNGGTLQLVRDLANEKPAPTLSADNRAVMRSQEAVGSVQTVRMEDLFGRALATLTIPADVEVTDWSGEYRQVGVRMTNPRGLRIINVADGRSRDLIDTTADVQAITWFDDSRRIAAIVFYDGIGVLVTMNADGSGLRKLPLASQPVRSPNLFVPPVEKLRVSPDGRYVAYLAHGRGLGGSSLDLVDLSTGKQQTLARALEMTQPFWHRDSRTIRYMRMTEAARTDSQRLSVHDVSLDGADRLVRAFPFSQYPRATFLMGENYVSNFGGDKYTLARLDGSPDQVLLRAKIPSPGSISSDGRTIVVSPGATGSDHKARTLMLLSTADGTQRTVDLPFTEGGCGPFSPDARYVYCNGREADSAPQTLYEVPVDGSKPRLVAQSDSREIRGALALSPDGKWMLQTVSGVRRIAFVSLDFTDGMTRLLSPSAKR